ncbi:MAG: TraB/VirB10 family protein [Desulfobulbus sp.]|jgi:conjugal transfer pilus assembly protein TraB|uniref:TraB/VirB10 family protein n=1 Tax=Desulfobulbus sp. TaxID=895 RepID=UPI0028402524|nr:TraB/VirB10 family protein [Desulfobulbus sp.]MDR2548942.1 TraB/VirB10 family protein [Desulfobulbus sp.]
MKIKERFDRLTPARKKIVIWSLIGAVLLVIVVTGYSSRSTHQPGQSGERGQNTRLEPDLMEKTIVREYRRKLEELEGHVSTMQRDLERGRKDLEANERSNQKPAREKELPKIPEAGEIERGKAAFPPPLQQPVAGGEENPHIAPAGNQKDKKRIGKITVVKNDSLPKGDAKKKGRTVYLPPSFMEANLLTGFDAATSGTSKNSPEPLLLRIKTPAVLPNDIKAELSGCFVVAEAVGRLDKERADVRLVSLSCLSNEGKAVIDAQVKGFVTDADSKVGLSGRVVSRMGAATVRAIVAGLFEGAGDALKASATTTSTSPLGSTSTIDGSKVGKSALGTGLSQGAQTMSDFYLDLVKQTTPVIEVGAAKKITVIVSEGKELEIRDIKNNEFAQQ